MMPAVKISKKSEYAVRALVEIASRHREGEWRQISQIAEVTGIPEKFLEQILLVLKNRGLLKSRRGAVGGYALNCNPAEVTIDQVVDILDGSETEAISSKDAGGMLFGALVQNAEKAFRKVLQKQTLADLAEEVRKRQSRPSSLEYQI